MQHPLKVMPLGGLGEIGMNCMLIAHRDRWIMVDAGIQFPGADEFGVERRLPDLEVLDAFQGKIEAIVITHGHEDHIGALPWTIRALGDIPIFAPAFARELIRMRLREHGMWRDDRVTVHQCGEPFTAGPFTVESVRVTHSMPDCTALYLTCEDGSILHTGDWKIDEAPVDGDVFDRERFAEIGDAGLTLLLSDSTNIRSPGWTRGEAAVGDALCERIAAWDGRVIVGQFSSNVHRLRTLVQAAEATDRQLVFAGGSLYKYLDAAECTGRAPIGRREVISMSDAATLEPGKSLIVATGTQGEKMATMYRASTGRHPHLRILPGDLFLHSARVIPGNEAGVFGMFNDLSKQGAEVVYGRNTGIHASGHARQDELKEMFDLLRPAHFIPVHGEYTFLREHAKWANDNGVGETTVLQNGETFAFGTNGSPRQFTGGYRIADQPLTIYYNDGPATGTAEEMKLKERLKVAWNGVVAVSVVQRPDGRFTVDKLDSRALWLAGDRIYDEIKSRVEEALNPPAVMDDDEKVIEAVRIAVRSATRRLAGKRAEVMTFVHREGPA